MPKLTWSKYTWSRYTWSNHTWPALWIALLFVLCGLPFLSFPGMHVDAASELTCFYSCSGAGIPADGPRVSAARHGAAVSRRFQGMALPASTGVRGRHGIRPATAPVIGRGRFCVDVLRAARPHPWARAAIAGAVLLATTRASSSAPPSTSGRSSFCTSSSWPAFYCCCASNVRGRRASWRWPSSLRPGTVAQGALRLDARGPGRCRAGGLPPSPPQGVYRPAPRARGDVSLPGRRPAAPLQPGEPRRHPAYERRHDGRFPVPAEGAGR